MLKLKRNEKAYQTMKAAGVELLTVSRRNKKLVPNKETAFIIWNLPAVMTCPYRTPMCEKFCYARKAETAYPTCKPARMRNFDDSRKADFVERMTYTILSVRRGCRSKNLVVRIHESGDFYNAAYTAAWLEIMERCKGERITFIAYTKSFTYFDGVKLPANFSLRASLWDDTPAAAREIVTRNGWNIYTAVPEFKTGDAFTRCRCNDCATCGKCWANYKDIRCEIH